MPILNTLRQLGLFNSDKKNLKKYYTIEDAENFFLHNSSGSITCVDKYGKERICHSFPEAKLFLTDFTMNNNSLNVKNDEEEDDGLLSGITTAIVAEELVEDLISSSDDNSSSSDNWSGDGGDFGGGGAGGDYDSSDND